MNGSLPGAAAGERVTGAGIVEFRETMMGNGAGAGDPVLGAGALAEADGKSCGPLVFPDHTSQLSEQGCTFIICISQQDHYCSSHPVPTQSLSLQE